MSSYFLPFLARLILLGGLGVAVSAMAGSEPQPTQSQSASTQQQSTAQSPTEHHSTGTSSADRWSLSEIEWQRYQSLKQGIRSSVSPATLSPIEVLGIHARDARERRRYAEQWARMMRDDAERILAFQRAYDAAYRRLFPDGELIDTRGLASFVSPQGKAQDFDWLPQDRILFFTATQCPSCDAVLERLLSQLTHVGGIDLYLVDVPAGEEARIREWAAARRIDPQWVSQQKVTLNIDAGALHKVAVHTGQQASALPLLVRRRGEQFSPLPLSRF